MKYQVKKISALQTSKISAICNAPWGLIHTLVGLWILMNPTGDPEKDAEPFRRYQLIRLASNAGGDANDASSLRIYSMVCVHLWCLWDYIEGREIEVDGEKLTGNIECPCHGSNYDPRTGQAHKGPAMLQSKPNDALPTLPVEVDEKGDVWVLPPDTALDKNGVVGMGRYVEL